MAGYGLVFDSLLPLQHDTSGTHNRKWISLAGVFNNAICSTELNFDSNPGLMMKWLSSGTNRPDIGWSGLRDLGDSSFIEDLTNNAAIYKEFGIKKSKHFRCIRRNIAFFNTIMDNIIAVMVLRARLMHDDEAYHYHNPQAIYQLKLFIETILTTFLQRYYEALLNKN